jgi:hypothetical protein
VRIAAAVLGLGCGEAPVDWGPVGEVRSQALSDVSQVLGFENPADWSVSQGTKSASSEPSQGSASLAVSNFTFTTVTSVPLPTPLGVTDTLALDLRVPAVPAWGELSIFISIPSRNVFEQKVGQKTIAGLPAGAFGTLSFQVPPQLVDVLRGSYEDLRIKISLNAPQTAASYLLDNLRFVGESSASRVEIEVSPGVDDFVYASVDGIRKKVWYIGDPDQGRRIDVTSWFTAGDHTLRLQAINTVGPASYGVRVYVDGAVALDAPCPANVCNANDAPRGIIFDRTLTLTTPDQPAAQAVRVTSPAPGKLYVDDAFTGLTTTGSAVPVSLSLPPGEHTIGLGVSEDSPPDYTGSFFERTVTLGNAGVDVNFASAAPLPVQERTTIAIVPVRNFVVDTFPADEVGVLDDADVSHLDVLSQATRDEWLEPFSYGLVSWDLDLLPVVEGVALHARTHTAIPDADGFLEAAGLAALRQQYEIVLLYYDVFDDDGSVLRGVVNGSSVDFNASAWGGGGLLWFNTLWVSTYGDPTGPNPALLHEALHNYEGYNEGRAHFYNGTDGMHGDDEHGHYSGDGGELDFALYQRLYMRNQVAELASTRVGVPVSSPSPRADLWVGVFDTMRGGYSPLE